MRKNVFHLYLLFSIAGCVAFSIKSVAQKVMNDTSYYETYPDKLTGRLYLAQKFLKFTIPPSGNQTDIEYKANTKMNIGIGVTYRNISANIFYGFAFLNKDTAKGETKGLDLQLQLYPRRWAIDLIALFPKGYYMYPKGYASSNPNNYYYRPDVQLKLISVSAYKVPNKAKFSYRAAVKLSEWQKRSAGSPLYGGTIYYGTAQGDSALVPKSIESSFPQKGISNVNFMALGAGIGYAYTLVIAKHFFITASALANLDLTFSSEEGSSAGKQRKTSIGPSIVAKGGLGYNSSTWSVGVNALASTLWTKGSASAKNYYLPVGNFRLIVSRKFNVKKRKEH